MQKQSRTSLLLSNMIVYGFNQVIVVLIPMIMLPIYSRLLPDISVFGASSLTTTISTLASAIAGFGMFDAAVRFAFDNDDNEFKKKVCSSAFVFMLCSSLVVCLMIILLNRQISILFYGSSDYKGLVVIAGFMAFFTVMNSAALIPIRITNKKKITLINSLIKAVATAVITLVLLFNGFYLYAIPIGSLIGLIVSWFFSFFAVQRKYILLKKADKELIKRMFVFAVPLMITFVSYWIYQSADKIMLSNISNLTETGIYSIGAKVGSVSGVLQNAFASGWAYFAFSTMKDADQKEMIARIFRLFTLICVVMSLSVMAFISPVFRIVFAEGEYLAGAPICAALFFAPLQLTLMQIIGSQLLIAKKTKVYSLVQLFGAITNVIFNFILIQEFGARGAATSTLIGYSIPLLIMYFYLVNKKEIIFDIKVIITLILSILLVIISTLYIYNELIVMLVGSVGILLIIILNISDLKLSVSYIKSIRKKRKE